MITLYGRLNSLNVQKVVFALGEVGVPYERIDAGLSFGIVDTTEYRAMNPNGLVPTLKDGDLVLWESNAIVRYLAAKYSVDSLWPSDPADRAPQDAWMDWQAQHWQSAVGPAFLHLIRTPAEKRDMDLVERSRQAADRLAGILDAALAGREWLGGARPGLGDIALGPLAHRWLNLPVARTPRPDLERWYGAIAARPAAEPFLGLPLT
jgi:glutathione S-transferase